MSNTAGEAKPPGILASGENKTLVGSVVVATIVGPFVPAVGGVAVAIGWGVLIRKGVRVVHRRFRENRR
ncbi:MAG: hypothetical protein AAB639_03225 [Patescibacteria group bacterium]